MNKELMNKIEVARTNIFISDPFLGYILQHINVYISKDIKSAMTNGKTIQIGEDFLGCLSIEETIFILMHELLHIILQHPSRSVGKEQVKFNVACDIVVNDIIKHYDWDHGNLHPIYGDDLHINSFMNTAEEIYKSINITKEKNLLDNHIIWLENDSSDIEDMNRIAKLSLEARNKGYNTDNTKLKRYLSQLLISKKKHNWRKILKQYISKDLFDYTFNRIDHRYQEVLLPSFVESEEELRNIWFLVDVSGSMKEEELSIIYGEINHIISHYKTVKCDISFFSTKTTKPMAFRNKKTLIETAQEMKSTGGTDFRQIFGNLKSYYKKKKPHLMVILTDGYSYFPKKEDALGVPVIWCLTRNTRKPPFGQIIYLTEN